MSTPFSTVIVPEDVEDINETWIAPLVELYIGKIGEGSAPSLERDEDEGFYLDKRIEKLALSVIDSISEQGWNCHDGELREHAFEQCLQEFIQKHWNASQE